MLFSLVLILSAQDVSAASLTLEWDPPIDGLTTGYIIHYGTTSKKYSSKVSVGLHYKFRVDGLADDKLYCFAIQAHDAAGTLSALSAETCGRTAVSGGGTTTPPPSTSTGEIVMYTTFATKIAGNWALGLSSGAASGVAMRSADRGWSATSAALASPTNYFEQQFSVEAGTLYRVWFRLRAGANSKWNDSVYAQFTNSLASGASAYRIGSTSSLTINLERCDSCGVSGWGWSNSSYWLSQDSIVSFATTGTQTMRIQTREDGVEIDQIVLSPVKYLSSPPGPTVNDATILAPTATASSPPPAPTPTPPPGPASTPFFGTALTVPSTIDAAYFDNGGAGVAYVDSTTGNSGGAFRTTDVDLQASSVGGYNIGWTTAGEWVRYTINVPTARSYTLDFRVASTAGGTIEFVAGAPSNVTRSITVPKTSTAQNFTTVSIPVTLAAGTQTFTVRFKTAGVNFRSLTVK